jgi:hypothetical protein
MYIKKCSDCNFHIFINQNVSWYRNNIKNYDDSINIYVLLSIKMINDITKINKILYQNKLILLFYIKFMVHIYGKIITNDRDIFLLILS